MPYAKFDDRYDDHKKIKRALRRQPAAVALHAMAITYCSRHITDGLVDVEWVDEKLAMMPFRASQRSEVVSVLLDCELFEHEGDTNYRVHDFLQWNLSAAQRSALSEQGRRGGLAKAAKTGDRPTDDSSQGHSQGFSEGSSQGHSQGFSEGSSTPTPTPTPTPKSQTASETNVKPADPRDVENCQLLADLLVARDPKLASKVAPMAAGWLTEMRRLRVNDGRDSDVIQRGIRWSQSSSFWAPNIMSPAKLRKQFPVIWGQMQRDSAPATATHLPEYQRASPEHQAQLDAHVANPGPEPEWLQGAKERMQADLDKRRAAG